MNEAFTTAEHPMLPFMSQNHSSVEKNTKLCYYSKTTALKSKKNQKQQQQQNLCCLVSGGLVLKLQAEASSSVAPYHHWSCPRSKSLLYVAQHHSSA